MYMYIANRRCLAVTWLGGSNPLRVWPACLVCCGLCAAAPTPVRRQDCSHIAFALFVPLRYGTGVFILCIYIYIYICCSLISFPSNPLELMLGSGSTTLSLAHTARSLPAPGILICSFCWLHCPALALMGVGSCALLFPVCWGHLGPHPRLLKGGPCRSLSPRKAWKGIPVGRPSRTASLHLWQGPWMCWGCWCCCISSQAPDLGVVEVGRRGKSVKGCWGSLTARCCCRHPWGCSPHPPHRKGP